MYEIRLKLAIGILILSATTQCEEYKVTDRVYFDVQHGDKYVGRIVIGLFGEIAPKTVLNFKTLATNGIDGRSYKGTIFHRVIQRFMIQGGEIGGPLNSPRSIFGEVFEDENFTVKHNSPGMVSMANKGPNTNGCQFFITTVATSWLDGVHTVFGKVLQGQDVVHIIEHVKTDSDDVPLEPVKIVKSGVFKFAKNIYVTDETFTYSLMQWLRAGIVPLSFSFSILAFFHWAIRKLDGLT